jgi:hypothetical protein
MKNSSYTIGNQTQDFLACSAASQPPAPPPRTVGGGDTVNQASLSHLY